MPYTYSASARTLDENTPLVDRDDLLLICKEIDTDTPADETTSFISSAHTVVVTRLDGYGLSESLLTKIELYVAAHFAMLSYPAVERETLGPLSKKYVSKVDLGLNNSRYGQMALSMDPTGKLGVADKRAVKMYSIGSGIIVTEQSV